MDQEILDMLSHELPKRERLPISRAILICNLPKSQQLEKARKVVENRLDIEKTRAFVQNYIQNDKRDSIQRSKCRLTPKKPVKLIIFLKDALYHSERICEERRGYFEQLFKSSSNVKEDLKKMCSDIDKIIDNLTLIKESVVRLNPSQLKKTG
jgi:hypothetical protein